MSDTVVFIPAWNEEASIGEVIADVREQIPAVTHADGSGRVQTVTADVNPLYYRLLKALVPRVGVPVMLNTSFNVRGEPIVCSPEDAYRCFLATEMDALVLEDCVLLKDEQPASARAAVKGYERGFELD